ncbi:hypothetical protein BDN67DRAFT_784173 [Paxillus ammoniavirescens]|nr:hypothetical protein BDN67DRAFT_784173 [Paxillus ammoniavirescens]
MLKERFGRTRAWASAAASEVRWRAPFLCRRYDEAERGPTVEKAVVMEAQPIVEQEQVRENQPDKYIPIVEGQPVVKRELVVPAEHKRITEKDPAMEQEPVIEQELPLEQPGVEEVLIVIKKPRPERVHPRRRLGVLARAALRDRRATVHGYGSDETDNPLSTDTESESERDFQSSSEPWVDEDALPETLGAKLVAAIDADGESEVDFLRSRKTFPALDVDDYSSASEDSVADLSLVAHGPSNIAISDTEIRVSSTSSPLNYEAIQQWVSRVAPQPNKQDATINVCASVPLFHVYWV